MRQEADGISYNLFWNWLYTEARDSQRRRREFGRALSAIIVVGCIVFGTLQLPGLGTIAGVVLGVLVGGIIVAKTHADNTFDRLDALYADDAMRLVSAMALAPWNTLSHKLAVESLHNGVIVDLLDQIEGGRTHHSK